MRVRFAKSTGCPFGQFVIEADTKEDEAILACFLAAPRDEWVFVEHGSSYGHFSPSGFNFGWDNRKDRERRIADIKKRDRWEARLWRWLKDLRRYRIRVEVLKAE